MHISTLHLKLNAVMGSYLKYVHLALIKENILFLGGIIWVQARPGTQKKNLTLLQ